VGDRQHLEPVNLHLVRADANHGVADWSWSWGRSANRCSAFGSIVKMDSEAKTREMQLDEMADFHARLSHVETNQVVLSRRITAMEDGKRGSYDDDPMKAMGPVIWIMVLLTVAPIVLDLVKQWRSSQS
jgi:hypothetical protein